MARLAPPRPLISDDPRQSFDCGRPSLNHWLQRHAWRNQQAGTSRTSVVLDRDSGAIAAYISLSAAQIARAYLGKADQRNAPDPIPAVLLGQLAVDLRYQRQGVARDLVGFALTTAVRLSDDIGCFCVLTHPLDDGLRRFYHAFGFEDLPGDPSGTMALRIMDLKASGF